jgi:ribosome biogenesis protein BRX1
MAKRRESEERKDKKKVKIVPEEVKVVDEVVEETSSEEEATTTTQPAPAGASTDPYGLGRFKSAPGWVNKQRVILIPSRGTTPGHKHLLRNFHGILAHSKIESKFEKSESLRELVEIAELRSCNTVVYLEARKHSAFLYVAHLPFGPTLKFQLLNVHTMEEIKMLGNALKGSRPFLVFGNEFDQQEEGKEHMKLLKESLTRMFSIPFRHPKSKPFHDHAITLNYVDGKIWFRHYQVSPVDADHLDQPDFQQLTEIGPRFVLEPVLILEGSFSGKVIYKNEEFKDVKEEVKEKNLEKQQESINRKIQHSHRQEIVKGTQGYQENLEAAVFH